MTDADSICDRVEFIGHPSPCGVVVASCDHHACELAFDGDMVTMVIIGPDEDTTMVQMHRYLSSNILKWSSFASLPGDGRWARFRRWLVCWIGGAL